MQRDKPHRFRPSSYVHEKTSPHGVVFYRVEEGKIAGIGYKGNASKPAWHFTFRSKENLERYIGGFFEALKGAAIKRAARREARLKVKAADFFAVGDIVYHSWGYEQTNVDFYQVLKVEKRSVVLRHLAATLRETGFMSGETNPLPGQFTKDPERHFVQPGGSVTFEHGGGSKWDGKPKQCSGRH